MDGAHPDRPASLPDMLADAIARSPRGGCDEGGSPCRCITFRDYMAYCLYEPRFGYYRGDAVRTGREGDFYTSAYVGDLMGELLADRFAQLADERFGTAGPVEVIDWGGGTGRLSLQMLRRWREREMTPSRFVLTLADGNPGHLRLARETLAEDAASGAARILTDAEAEACDWRDRPAILVGNELLDAMPVHRVVRRGGRLWEWGVAWDAARGCPVPCRTEPSDPQLAAWMERDGIRLREGQTAELHLDAGAWLKARSGQFGEALLVFLDYGDASEELTAPHRMDGTLLCYSRHVAHTDPYALPGGQDLTAHVNFTSIRRAALEAGWVEVAYQTQKEFLVSAGILSRLSPPGDADPFGPAARRNRAVRQLLLTDGMSELFKVQIFAKSQVKTVLPSS
ncbi:class I SAM-dependent methyltransferase [Cohnella nanjingensis]|uniref:SAM-dependent methyltransferase n=1 Tax=Cohnella nanjingensis TaxID=1387779 RepID=A0A7X0VGM0_9BACL|nr:SAM-dependent methyltransferase [Cohnella nanjingensis]MBB6673237.1 SAM-dependent methyltransferase [Cohnella nanjingensis]